jgi:hypothetical protein
MTYLSYFMKEEDSPGYYSTLNWVKNQIPNFRINNFRVGTTAHGLLTTFNKKRRGELSSSQNVQCVQYFHELRETSLLLYTDRSGID